MKKLLVCLALVLALALMVTACNKDKKEDATTAAATTEQVTEQKTEAPATTEAPTTAETEAPTTSATEAPTTSETEAPTTSETEAPTTSETEAPTTSETEAPTTSETEAPTTSETEEPSTSETEEPSTDAPHDCADGDNDHNCDTCGEKVSDCADADYNGKCDVCGADCPIPGLSGAAGMHSPDTYKENGVIMVDGNADQWFAANRANDGISGVDTIGFRGWAFIGDGKTVAVADFGYGFKQVEGITWGFAPIVDENLYTSLEGRTEVRRYDITIDLTVLEETGEYDVILYVKDVNGAVYVMDRWVDVWVNYVNTFEQNSASSSAQADIDLGYGGQILTESGFVYEVLVEGPGVVAGGAGLITEKDGVAVWEIAGGFADWHTTTTGKYAYNVNFHSATGAAAAFVRGWDGGFTDWDLNYFGAAGNTDPEKGPTAPSEKVAFGKAGIYYYVQNGVLKMFILGWDDTNATLPLVNSISIPGCVGDITVVDLGNVIYFKEGEQTVAKIEVSGSATYGDISKPMCEYAKLTAWDGQVVEITKPLIAADYAGIHIGLAQRTGNMWITEISYGSAKGVSYNENLDVATSIATDKTIYTEGETVLVSASNGNKAYIGAYKAGTTELVDFYEMGTKDGFEGLKAGEYDIVLANFEDPTIRYRTVTIKVNPSDLISSYGPADFMLRKNETFGASFGETLTLSEDGSYVTFTMNPDAPNPALGINQGTDYNWYFCFGAVAGYEITGSNYMVVKYRTSATNIDKNEMFIGTGSIAFGAAGSNINFTDKVICDGEWNYLYINFEEYGVYDMNSCNALRFDFINGAPKDSTIDIEFIKFYKTDADAQAAVKKATTPEIALNTYDSFVNRSGGQDCFTGNAGFAPIYNAIQVQNPDVPMQEKYHAITGGDMLWLANADKPIDCSKYSKMIITFTCDRTNTTTKYDENAGNNKFELLNFETAGLAYGEYTLPAGDWMWNTCEIDISGVDYNGELLLRQYNSGLSGTWYVIHSVVLVP